MRRASIWNERDEGMKELRKLSKRTLAKRKKAGDSLHGIWASLTKKAQKELMKKSYPGDA